MKITGFWTYEGDANLFHQTSLFCPICKAELSKCVEGCTIHHFFCDNCGFRIIFIDQAEVWDPLFDKMYDAVL